MKPLVVILLLLTGCGTWNLADAQTFPKINGCGSSVGCFSDCAQNSCTFLISWSANGNMATYTLRRWVGSQSSGWLAIGFSQDSLMGNDDVLGCIFYNSTSLTKFTGKNGVHMPPTAYNDNEISLTSSTLVNGVLTCTLQRPVQASSTGRFDVTSPWVLLYALGPLNSNMGLTYHSWHTNTQRTVAVGSLEDLNTAIPTTASPTTPQAGTFLKVNECGNTVGCFSDCALNSCTFLISWRSDGNYASYTLMKSVGNQTSGWTAMGFSNDSFMGDDDIMGCFFYSASNITKFTGKNGVHTRPNLYNDADIILTSSSLNNGVLTCTFQRQQQSNATTGRVDVSSFWTLLLAFGPIDDTSQMIRKHSFHTMTPETVSVLTPKDLSTATTTAPPSTTALPTNKFSQIAGCGTTMGCFSDCQNQQCSYLVAWKQVGTIAEYTWKAYVGTGGNSWIAVGFSSDDKMGNDDVLLCFVDSQGSFSFGTGVNGDHSPPVSYTDSDVNQTARSYDNGVLTCTIQRPITSSTQVPQRVDVSKPWTFLHARGNGGSMAAMQHHSFIAISPQKFMVNETVNVKGPDTLPEYPLVKAHGSLMIAAWIFLASVGIVLARYYKPVWKGRLLSKEIWFQIHRLCMILVFLLTAIGFIIIFVEVDGYSKINESKEFLVGHPIIGIIVMILTVANPIMTIFRCAPDTPKRPIFNWAHWFVGTAAHILGVVNIFFGVLLTKAQVPYYLVYILGAYVAWQLFVEILLELLSFFGRKADKSEMYELSNGSSSKKITTEESSTIILIKRVILVVHVLVVAGFAAALIALLAIGQADLED